MYALFHLYKFVQIYIVANADLFLLLLMMYYYSLYSSQSAIVDDAACISGLSLFLELYLSLAIILSSLAKKTINHTRSYMISMITHSSTVKGRVQLILMAGYSKVFLLGSILYVLYIYVYGLV